MAEKSYDAAYFNDIANHPKVKPWIDEGLDHIDVQPFFDAGGFGVKTPHGGFILERRPGNVWRAHALFPPQPDRLNAAIEDCLEMLKLVFEDGAAAVTAETPETGKGVNELTRRVGFKGVLKAGTWHWSMSDRLYRTLYGGYTITSN